MSQKRKLQEQLQDKDSDGMVIITKSAMDIFHELLHQVVTLLSNDLQSELVWFFAVKRIEFMRTRHPIDIDLAVGASILWGASKACSYHPDFDLNKIAECVNANPSRILAAPYWDDAYDEWCC